MKKVSIVAFLSLFLLSGCGLLPLSAAEQSYVDDCKKVQANFNDYIKIQDEIYNGDRNEPRYEWTVWAGGSYLVTNAGQASRETASNFITAKFPWIYSATENFFKNMSRAEFLEDSPKFWTFDFESAVNEDFFRMLATGTNFERSVINDIANLEIAAPPLAMTCLACSGSVIRPTPAVGNFSSVRMAVAKKSVSAP